MSFVGTLQQFMSNIVANGPWFLAQKHISAFLESTGLTLDLANIELADGLRLGQPLRCDASALPILSRDRRIRLYSSEPEASKRKRLAMWLQLRRQFGTNQGMMRNIQPFFLSYAALPTIRIVHQDGAGTSATWHRLDPDGTYSWYVRPSNWNWDDATPNWSRTWCIIDVSVLGLGPQPTWDGGQLWDGGSLWDGLLNEQAIADLVAGLTEAKAAYSAVWGVIFATDPASFDPTSTAVTNADGSTTLPVGNWGFTVDSITGKPTRLQSAFFAYDRGPL